MNNKIWKVFVPYDLLTTADSYIFGHVTSDNQSVYIVASSEDLSLANQPPACLALIGCWKYLSTKSQAPIPQHSGEVSISLTSNESSELSCALYLKRKQQHCTCIVYNPHELLKSSVLRERSEVSEAWDNITTVVKVLNKARQDLSSYEVDGKLKTYCGLSRLKSTFKERLVVWLLLAVTWLYKPLMIFKISRK